MKPSETRRREFSGHFYSLDALRGLAALGVVVFHYDMFFYQGTSGSSLPADQLPFHAFLLPLYLQGWRAVDLFFCLSGFVFYWLYSERIARRENSAKEFTVLRFSRLYPLHLLTLLAVTLGQFFMRRATGADLVYPHNDMVHFVRQLFFVSSWGRENFYTFNGPVWSVSVEVFLYTLFFIASYLGWNRWWHLVLLLGVSRVCWQLDLFNLSRGTFSFFMGGLSYYAFSRLLARGISERLVLILIGVMSTLWVVVPLAVDWWGALSPSSISHFNFCVRAMGVVVRNSYELILYPMTLLALACCEAFRGGLGKRTAFLGNISYSVYLLHFPLQLACVFGATLLSVPRTLFASPIAFLIFFAVLIALGLASYHYYERPMQSLIRRNLLPRRAPMTGKAPA